jgi:hypothetical protein
MLGTIIVPQKGGESNCSLGLAALPSEKNVILHFAKSFFLHRDIISSILITWFQSLSICAMHLKLPFFKRADFCYLSSVSDTSKKPDLIFIYSPGIRDFYQ